MSEKFTYFSPIGPLCIETSADKICAVCFCDKEIHTKGFNHGLKKKITQQLDEYFAGNRFVFDLPIAFSGTEFQCKVWEQLQTIPYGRIITYGELAYQLGNKKLVRAVGGANSRNPLAIVVPCHRVIGSNNKLVGYAGGLWRKKWLLQHEQTNNPDKTTLI